MNEINLRVDLSPYTPDIFLKNNIYQSYDKVDYTTYIGITNTIFIFNINTTTKEEYYYYNDPNYLLYGNKKMQGTTEYNYKLPSLYFFISLTNTVQYIITTFSTVITPELAETLTNIGYNVNKIDTTSFYYAILSCIDLDLKARKNVVYFFFKVIDLFEIDYNNYNSTTYYMNKYMNVIIYPYVLIPTHDIISLNRNLNIISSNATSVDITKTYTFINPVDFDDREIIKYYEKIDYKYMERIDIYTNQNNKLEVAKNLAKYNVNFEDFYIKSLNKDNTIMISNNEISKVYFDNLDYENKNLNGYTLKKLNNDYLNNNKSYSGKEKKYSFSFDNKISYVKKLIDETKFRYNNYNYSIINIPSVYQMSKNYYVNGYIDINSNINNNLILTNSYLYKIYLLINPYIINTNYIISDNINFQIQNLFENNNNLTFGKGSDKIYLFHVNNKLTNTNTYYINKYKIEMSFTINNTIVKYIIILGICFYNGININFVYKDITYITDNIGYVMFTNIDNSVSLSPVVYNLSDNTSMYEVNSRSIYDIKKINLLVDLNNENTLVNNSKFKIIQITNYYTYLANFNNNNTLISNLFNITFNKINNFIKNIININNNIFNIKDDIYNDNIKIFLLNSILYDINLENNVEKYITNLSYYPIISQYDYLPQNINKYKLYSRIPENNNLTMLPAGNYKVIKYTNYFPKYELLEVNKINDNIVLNINEITEFLDNNFSLLIKLPNNAIIDDKFFVELNDNNNLYYLENSNYCFNIGNNDTEIYLVTNNSKNEIYYNSENIIYGYRLFNQYNTNTLTDVLSNKYKINLSLYISSYLNFYQMIIGNLLFNDYIESNSMLYSSQNSNLLLHNNKLLKDIVYYDFQRFNYDTNLDIITLQYLNYNESITNKLYDSKEEITIIQKNINKLIFILNTNKIVFLSKKCLNYLKLIKSYILTNNNNYNYLIKLINYNANECIKITLINYNLNTLYCTNNYTIQNLYNDLSNINSQTSLEDIVTLIYNIEISIKYFQVKINDTITEINNTLIINNYSEIFVLIITEINIIIDIYKLNLIIFDNITKNINNLNNIDNVDLLISNLNLTKPVVLILIEQIIIYLNIISLNTHKLDELINTVRFVNTDKTIDGIFPNGLNNNVIKNTFIYNTNYYNNTLNINNFDIVIFLTDLNTTIIYMSDPINSSAETSIYYDKAINQNISEIINTTISLFNSINNQIIGIYKYEHDINIGIIPKINIYEDKNIANFYYLLDVFESNYKNMSVIINSNLIDIFKEFNPLIIFFDAYINSIKEYLFYVQLILEFQNIKNNNNIYISIDILSLLIINDFNLIIKSILDIINKLSNGLDQELINDYLNNDIKINTDYSNKINKLYIQGDNIIIIQDFNILYYEFNNNSYNFNPAIINIINQYNNYKYTVFNYYYDTSNIEFYKELINYNYLDYKFNNNI
jgi:hypothetical protein